MKKTFHIISIVIMILSSVLFSQTHNDSTITITGKILDSQSHKPFPGLNILIKELGIGATCDKDGNFIIHNLYPGKYTLDLLYMGYRNQSIDISLSSERHIENIIYYNIYTGFTVYEWKRPLFSIFNKRIDIGCGYSIFIPRTMKPTRSHGLDYASSREYENDGIILDFSFYPSPFIPLRANRTIIINDAVYELHHGYNKEKEMYRVSLGTECCSVSVLYKDINDQEKVLKILKSIRRKRR